MAAATDPKHPTYPVNLCLDDMPVLVVGAGKVALRKVRGLMAAGALVTIVAPEVEPELAALAKEHRIRLYKRPYQTGEATEYRLVFSATGNEKIDWLVSYDAAMGDVYVNVADLPERCSFYLPAVVRRGHLNLSITTDGEAPFAARRLRERLERQFGEGYAAWLETAALFRQAVLEEVPDQAGRDVLFDRFCDETLPPAGAPAGDAGGDVAGAAGPDPVGPAPGSEPEVPDEATWRGWIAEVAPRDRGDDREGVREDVREDDAAE